MYCAALLHILLQTQQYKMKRDQWRQEEGNGIKLRFITSNQTKCESSLKDTALNRTSLNPSLITRANLTSLCSQSKIVQTALNTPLPYKRPLNGEIKKGVNEKNTLLVATISKASIDFGV